ncbi:MAG: hypothetical protein UT37_C0011G0019 [Parcubacteria group bacterium GW2011_GWA2_39_18]|nr:MAG: hypothetical protein UT37_C0011G0019 [Parcubacteria group bacterium GW2011_GWA2_39_18]
MKKSSIMHWIARIIGVWGGLSLVGAWIAGESGAVLGFSQQHLYNDAIVLTLIAISSLVCTLVYLQEEKNQ